MVSTRGVRYKFTEGERVLCYEPDPTKAKVLYDSKVLEVIESKDKRGRRTIEYLIHFQGWNSSWDRCVGEDFVLKDTEENRQLQRDLADKSQLQLGAYLYRRERKKGSTSSSGAGPAKRSRQGFSDDGSSSSTQPDEMEGEGEGERREARGGAEAADTDSSSGSGASGASLPRSPPPNAPMGRAQITLPSALRDRLTFDYHLVVKRGRLSRLPATPCVAQILESFVKWFARAGAWSQPRARAEPPQRPDLLDVSCRLNLVREVADGLRVYFDFILRGHLLYKQELRQYHQICGQFIDEQDQRIKEEYEDDDSMSQDEEDADGSQSAEDDLKSPKIPEYSHLPPDPEHQDNGPQTSGGQFGAMVIKKEIKEEPIDEPHNHDLQMDIKEEFQEDVDENEYHDDYEDYNEQDYDEQEYEDEESDEQESEDEEDEDEDSDSQDSDEEESEDDDDENEEETEDEENGDDMELDENDEHDNNMVKKKHYEEQVDVNIDEDFNQDGENQVGLKQDQKDDVVLKHEDEKPVDENQRGEKPIVEEQQNKNQTDETQGGGKQVEVKQHAGKEGSEKEIVEKHINVKQGGSIPMDLKLRSGKLISAQQGSGKQKQPVGKQMDVETEQGGKHGNGKQIICLKQGEEKQINVEQGSGKSMDVKCNVEQERGKQMETRQGAGKSGKAMDLRKGVGKQLNLEEGEKQIDSKHEGGKNVKGGGTSMGLRRSIGKQMNIEEEDGKSLDAKHGKEKAMIVKQENEIHMNVEHIGEKHIGLKQARGKQINETKEQRNENEVNVEHENLIQKQSVGKQMGNDPEAGKQREVKQGGGKQMSGKKEVGKDVNLAGGKQKVSVKQMDMDEVIEKQTDEKQINLKQGGGKQINAEQGVDKLIDINQGDAKQVNVRHKVVEPMDIDEDGESHVTQGSEKNNIQDDEKQTDKNQDNLKRGDITPENIKHMDKPQKGHGDESEMGDNHGTVKKGIEQQTEDRRGNDKSRADKQTDENNGERVVVKEEIPEDLRANIKMEIKQEREETGELTEGRRLSPLDGSFDFVGEIRSRTGVARAGLARRLRSHKSAVSQSETDEPMPSTSTGEPRACETVSSSVGSSGSSVSEGWARASAPARAAAPAPPAPPTRTPLSLLLEKVANWQLLPREGTEHLPCRVYGAIHLSRLFVKLPDFLNATQMPDFKLKLIVKHIDMFVRYLEAHNEWFGEHYYFADSLSRSA